MINDILIDYLSSIVCSLFYVVFISVLGIFATRFLNKDYISSNVSGLLAIFTGLLLSISLYALIATKGNSIFFLPLLILLYFLISRSRLENFNLPKLKSVLAPTAIFSMFFIILSLIQLFRLDFFNSTFVRLGKMDYGYYSDMAEYISISGIEHPSSWYTLFRDEYVNYSLTPLPYHYFELYIHAIFLQFCPLKGILVFNFITIPFISSLAFIGFYTIARCVDITQPKYISILLSALFVFYVGMIPFKYGGWMDSVFLYPRTISFILPFQLFTALMISKRQQDAIVFLSFIPLFHILTAPTIFTVVGLYVLYLMLYKKSYLEGVESAIIVFVSAIGILLFYFHINKGSEDVLGGGLVFFSEIKEIFYYFTRRYLFRVILYFFPFTLAILIFRKKILQVLSEHNLHTYVFFISFLILFSMILSSSIDHMEAYSFSNVIITSSISVTLFVLLIAILNKNKSVLGKIWISILLFSSVYYCGISLIYNKWNNRNFGKSFDLEYLTKLKPIILSIQNPIGGQILNEEYFISSPWGNNHHISRNTSYTDFYKEGMIQISLSTPEELSKIPFPEIHGSISLSPFFRYVQSQKLKNEFNSMEQSQIAFIKKYNIEYVIVQEGGKISNLLESKIARKIEDENSKQIFLLIDKSKI